MAISIRKLGKRFFVIANVLVSILFLLACLQPWLHPQTFWFLGYTGIVMPYLAIIVAAFILFWLMWRSKMALISIITLGIGWKQAGVLFNLDRTGFEWQKTENKIRVLSWNIKGFNGLTPGRKAREANADSVFNMIVKLQPDVICFQEYGQYEADELGRNYLKKLNQLGYPHYVLSRDYSRKTFSYSSGSAIFSKHPVVGSQRVPFSSSIESLIFADILFMKDTIRVFNTHLQSFRLSADELDQVEKIKNKEKPSYTVSTSMLGKMKRAFRNRGSQVDQITPFLDSTHYPEILCLDMNDVPNSYAYWHLRGKRKDAFLEKGFGIGRTFISIAPTLRIDYIFADPRMEVTQFKVLPQRYSDHHGIVADLLLAK